jgi:hypothetical protein
MFKKFICFLYENESSLFEIEEIIGLVLDADDEFLVR